MWNLLLGWLQPIYKLWHNLCGQTFRHSTIVNYDTRVILTGKLPKLRLKICNLWSLSVCEVGHRSISSQFQAVFRKANADIGNPGISCSTIEMEEHTDCKCGCDVEAASCTPLQVRISKACVQCVQSRQKFNTWANFLNTLDICERSIWYLGKFWT